MQGHYNDAELEAMCAFDGRVVIDELGDRGRELRVGALAWPELLETGDLKDRKCVGERGCGNVRHATGVRGRLVGD